MWTLCYDEGLFLVVYMSEILSNTGFRVTYMFPSRKYFYHGGPCIFHQDNVKPHSKGSGTKLVCLPSLSSHSLGYFAHHGTKNVVNETPKLLSHWNPLLKRNEAFHFRTLETSLLIFQTFTVYCKKKRWCNTMASCFPTWYHLQVNDNTTGSKYYVYQESCLASLEWQRVDKNTGQSKLIRCKLRFSTC